MGSSTSKITAMEEKLPSSLTAEAAAATSVIAAPPPPKPRKKESFEEKVWRKFSSQPLIPIGCVTTAYFLFSGLKSFKDRDPFKSQRMMRNRVAAQFATLLAFVGYVGIEQFDFRLAPMTQDAEKLKKMMAEAEAAEKATSANGSRDE